MAASPIAVDGGNMPPEDKWDHPNDTMVAAPDDNVAPNGGGSHPGDEHHSSHQQPPEDSNDYNMRGESAAAEGTDPHSASRSDATHRGEKQIKPNKVYIGGLPEHTRKEDLQSCFGKIGTIVNIELKVGYGFVEFESREAAEESVAKYHEGYFMGNKIRVELSRGGGRTAKYGGDPGACFKCGQVGHWARECPNSNGTSRHPSDAPLIDRIQPPRDYPPPPPRDYPPYRDEYPRYPPPRDPRYGYDYPPPREFRRPPSPPRDYRDFPPPVRPPLPRDVDDYRLRGAPPLRLDPRPGYYAPEGEPLPPPGYPPSRYGPPRDYYDRYDRRAPPPDRYAPYPPPPVRARTPPGGPPPRARDDLERDRPPTRDYPPADYRGRPVSPPPPSRYADYPPRTGSTDAPRYRRRSQSPPPRTASGAGYESGYPPSSGAAYTGGSSTGFAGNGYSGGGVAPSSRGSTAARDYPPPRSREGDSGTYRRP
ncbi:unnamed protein product [Somion occarium]|uniref:RNA-binding domain-containing protein n=1 Tax=Somion occarium TaxID=3059160 RepID=A0ABP1CND2_9APHY